MPASGCSSGTIVGWTPTARVPSGETEHWASSLITQRMDSAAATSSLVTDEIPSQETSDRRTRVWNASEARMAAFAAASWPSTSAVGSASA